MSNLLQKFWPAWMTCIQMNKSDVPLAQCKYHGDCLKFHSWVIWKYISAFFCNIPLPTSGTWICWNVASFIEEVDAKLVSKAEMFVRYKVIANKNISLRLAINMTNMTNQLKIYRLAYERHWNEQIRAQYKSHEDCLWLIA